MAKSEDEQFLDEALGNLLDKDDEIVTEEVKEAEEKEELTEEELKELEEKAGRKLSEEEIEELKGVEIPEDFELIQPEKLPKELQPHFKRMFASFTKKMQNIADVQKKAELWDYFQQNPQFFADKLSVPSREPSHLEQERKDPTELFLEKLNLPEDNELTPTVKYLAKELFNLKKETIERTETLDRENFKEKLNLFFERNPGIKEDVEFIRTMDRIGMENPNLYRDLERLKKYAIAELGREPKSKQQSKREIDIHKLYREMKEAKKQKVSKPSSSVTTMQIKKPANVAEAFRMAEEQLRRK